MFKVNGEPLLWTPKQREIGNEILYQLHNRVQVIAPTQYGKSLTVAGAITLRLLGWNEKFTILAPSEKKAGIIMGYVIDHVFDQPSLVDQLELDPGEKLDRLRRQRSRNHLTFRGGSGVQVLTLDAKNTKRNIEAAMGFGGNRLVLDESSLIPDPLYATVKRMLGGYKYRDAQLFEIGNPFYRNHFYRTWHSTRYHRIFIDYLDGIEEGRFSEEFIDEMREEALFDVFYECQFPDEDTIDERGYRQLVSTDLVEESFVQQIRIAKDDDLWAGFDIGGGGDFNVCAMRTNDMAWIESKNRSSDTMTNVTEIQRLKKEYPNLQDNHILVDDTGIGHGVSDRCHELGIMVSKVVLGASPQLKQDQVRYKNVKAQATWLMGQWLKAGGKLLKHQGFMQIPWLKYKISTDKVLMTEPKQELVKRTGKSPDFADALMVSFAPPPPELNIRFA